MHVVAFLCLTAAGLGAYQPSRVLAVDGTRFTLNGEPVFLLGCSYYGALSAGDEWIREDLTHLCDAGFNWVRVWVTWSAYDNDVSVVDTAGAPREPRLSRFKQLLAFADGLGMVVDVTFSRGTSLPTHQAHLAAARALAAELKPYRNAYFDLGNERNIRDPRYVSMAELGELVRAVKEVDRDRLVTGSQAGDISDDQVRDYLQVARVDFLAPHRPRGRGSPAQTEGKTKHYLSLCAELGRSVPVHYQEPFRRDFNAHQFQPTVDDFFADALGALRGGAAGWCLHLGDNRAAEDRRPRRGFDLRPEEGRFFDQIDDVERRVIAELAVRLGLR